jgi:hypothetical protein
VPADVIEFLARKITANVRELEGALNRVVAYAGRHGGHGNYVRLNHGGGLATGYAHMSRIAAAPGQRVRRDRVEVRQGKTEPPAAYTEATLLAAMEHALRGESEGLVVRSLSPRVHRTLGLVLRKDKLLHRGLRETLKALPLPSADDVARLAVVRASLVGLMAAW